MKPIYLVLIIFILRIGTTNAQKYNFITGKVIKYTKVHNYKHTIVDTIIGHFRSLTIDTVTNKVWIQFEVEGGKVPIEYNITKTANTINNNQTTKKNEPYLNIHLKDNSGYPMLIMLSTDLNVFYLYYFWDNTENGFLKSEKIEITERKNISL